MKLKFKKTWQIALFVLMLSSAVLISCGDDDKDEPKVESFEEMIVGVWSDDATSDWCDGGNSNGSAYGYEFKKNGSCYVHGSCYGNGRYQIFDDQLVITYKDYNDDDTYTERYTIVKLTETILELTDGDYFDPDVETYYRIK